MNINRLELQQFIENHGDWEDLLSKEPYCLEIKYDSMFGRRLVLFKYNMIGSDFSQSIVKESRGLVLDADTFEPIVVPFFKFFNSHEEFADKIDWSTAKVTEKLDGSIVKIVKMSPVDVLIGTNSNIDAFKAPLAEQVGCKAKNFGELVLEGLAYYGLNESSLASMLEYDKTYIFELTSPYNQVVVKWTETKLNFIGIRDNKTLQEEKFEDHHLAKVFNIPKIYDLSSEKDCIAAAAELGDDVEGYVVRDANFKRIKIKSPRYLELHRLAGNGVLSLERAIDIVKIGEEAEIISYFPHFEKPLNEVKKKYDKLILELEITWNEFNSAVDADAARKEAAMWINSHFKIPGVGFALLDGRFKTIREWLEKMPSKNIIKYIGE